MKAAQLKSGNYIFFGHVGFVVLLFLSIYFFRERIFFNDTVFQFFKIVNFEHSNIEANRYSTFITQIPLLVFLKFNVGLHALATIFSISFVATYYLVYVICSHFLRNPEAGMAVLFSLIIGVSASYYHPVTETHQAIVYSILFYAILRFDYSPKWTRIRYLAGGLTILLCFFSHPVALFTCLFLILYTQIEQKKWNRIGDYTLLLLLFLLAFLKLKLTNTSSYEGSFFSELLAFQFSLSSLIKTYSLHFFTSRFFYLYFWLVFLWLTFVVVSVMQQKYLKTGYVIFATLIFFIITLITYAQGDADVMMERSFMPLSVFVLVPFFGTIRKIKSGIPGIVMMIMLVVVFFSSMIRITNEGIRNKERLAYVNSFSQNAQTLQYRKILLQKTPENTEKILYTWPLAFTTLVSSSLNGPNASRTIFLIDDITKYVKYTSEKTTIFLGTDFWLEWNSQELNQRFFQLPNEPYVFLEEN